MPQRALLSLAVVGVCGLVVSVKAKGCFYLASDFTCSHENARSVMTSSGCQCFSCTEQDNSVSYACNDAPSCGGTYTVAGSDANETLTRSTSEYLAISTVFIAASLIVYGLLRAVARWQAKRKYGTNKSADVRDQQSLVARSYRFVHAKVFGSLLTAGGNRTRRLTEYWVAECQLLDCFSCCAHHERPRRQLSLRLLRLASSLLVTASISFFFGTLEFDMTACSTFADIRLCSASTSSGRSLTAALEADSVTNATTTFSSTTSSTTTTNDSSTTTVSTNVTSTGGTISSTPTTGTGTGGPTTTTSIVGGSTTTTSTTASTSSSSQINSVVTTNSCASLPLLSGSLSKASSLLAFLVTQCVKFVGSYAQNLGKPDSRLDWCAHVTWLLVAAAAIPVMTVLSTRHLRDGAYTLKSEKLRMRLILSVTLSAWLQVQLADLFKVPVVYFSKKVGHTMLPSPDDVAASNAVQRRLRELDCLGGQHTPESTRDERAPTRVDALTAPSATR